MTPPSYVPIPGLDLSPPLALAVVLGVIAVALYGVRAYQRRQNREERRRLGWFMTRCQKLLRGEIRDVELDRAAARTTEGEFWTALERLSLRWRRSDWGHLSRALENVRHAPTERRALRDDSPWRQVLAARRLAMLRSRSNRRALRGAMLRGPEITTLACAMALARYRDIAALRWLLRNSDRISRRPRSALRALLGGFGQRGRAELITALDVGVTAQSVERAVMDTLGVLKERTARPAIEQRLRSPELELRVAAARALGRMQAVESGTLLLAALRDDAWAVRAHAARALGEARVVLAVEPLAARMSDPVWWVRHHAAYALADLGEEGQAMLRTVLRSSPDPYARDMAREALDDGPRLAA
jgi:HEAT repeat protein